MSALPRRPGKMRSYKSDHISDPASNISEPVETFASIPCAG